MKEKLLDILVEICEEEAVRENPDANLFEEGFLDSLAMTEVLIAIEDHFGVTLSPTEYDKEQLSSVNKIAQVLVDKGASL